MNNLFSRILTKEFIKEVKKSDSTEGIILSIAKDKPEMFGEFLQTKISFYMIKKDKSLSDAWRCVLDEYFHQYEVFVIGLLDYQIMKSKV